MKSLKDFFYDKNDIVLTIIILVAAGLLISWRLDVIMEYPATLAKETHTTVTTQDEVPEDTESDSEEKEITEIWENGTLTQDVTVTVQTGSAENAVNCLVYAGLFDSYDQFSKVCKKAGRKAENIKATTYTFPSGSTQKKIAKIVTN